MKKTHSLGRLAASIIVVGSMFGVAVAAEVKTETLKPEHAKPTGADVMKVGSTTRSLLPDAPKPSPIESAGLDTTHTGAKALPAR